MAGGVNPGEEPQFLLGTIVGRYADSMRETAAILLAAAAVEQEGGTPETAKKCRWAAGTVMSLLAYDTGETEDEVLRQVIDRARELGIVKPALDA